MKNFYVTTPIYYPSGKLHLGHAYTTIAGDVIKKYKKQQNFDVFYLTGSDEHGEKIEKKAIENNTTPIKFVDEIVSDMKVLWKSLGIDYNKFIRTTDAKHVEQVQKIFEKLIDNGDVYLGEYEGKYCTSCESYFTDLQLNNGKCPDCRGEVKIIKEESYFFKCSKYVDRLVEHFDQNPNFILPVSRKNELIKSFIEPGLQDLAVSRTNFTWGIPVKKNEEHVIYVWIDALSNYITALDYGKKGDDFQKYWPADIHLVGKEIIRFHAIYWPMILMALDLPLPKQIFAHGWLLMDKDKMSKSKGNVIYPDFLIEEYGMDSVRYYLMREVSFGADGQFTPETFVNRFNNDLVNDLGNLVNRTIAMINKYYNGNVKSEKILYDEKKNLNDIINKTIENHHSKFETLEFSKVLENIWNLISNSNKFIDLTKPWTLDPKDDKEMLSSILFELSSAIKVIAFLVEPFIPNTSVNIYKNFNLTNNLSFENLLNFEEKVSVLKNPIILFERLNKEEEIEKIKNKMISTPPKKEETISFDYFMKSKIVVGEIIESKKIEDSKNLLVSTIDIGSRKINVVSGIATFYDPIEIIGRKVQVVENLEPVKIKGVLSEGMVLCAENKRGTKLITLDKNLQNGMRIK